MGSGNFFQNFARPVTKLENPLFAGRKLRQKIEPSAGWLKNFYETASHFAESKTSGPVRGVCKIEKIEKIGKISENRFSGILRLVSKKLKKLKRKIFRLSQKFLTPLYKGDIFRNVDFSSGRTAAKMKKS